MLQGFPSSPPPPRLVLVALAAVVLSQADAAAAQNIVELLETRSLTLTETDCHYKKGDRFTIVTVHVRIANGVLHLASPANPGAYSAYAVTRPFTTSGNTLSWTTSSGGKKVITFSADGSQCSFKMSCMPSHPVGHAISCTVNSGGGQQVATQAPEPAPQQQSKSSRATQPTPKQTARKGGAPQAPARSSSCSDISGTNSAAPAATHCKDADRALYAARQIKQSNPQLAATEYRKAASAARAAGDTNLELSILREASNAATAVIAALPAPEATSAPNISGASTPPQPAARGRLRMWDGRRETCNTAGDLERSTASWYVMCIEPKLPERQAHRPNPDPLALSKQAREACGSYARDTQKCFADFKLKVILQNNPDLRRTCENEAAKQSALRRDLAARLGRDDGQARFLECVDNTYLYGDPDRSSDRPRRALRDMVREAMNAGATEADDAGQPGARRLFCSTQSCCPPGQGMKPTPGAFGAWSCQPLGLLALKSQKDAAPSDAEENESADLEARIDSLLVNAAVSALAALGAALRESERNVCMQAALASAHAMLKGGSASVPQNCRAMAEAARAHVAYYADAHVDHANAAMEDLLGSFRSDLGAPQPGMSDLTPDETLRRHGECIRRGGSTESCN